jgi:hypothetical protein
MSSVLYRTDEMSEEGRSSNDLMWEETFARSTSYE